MKIRDLDISENREITKIFGSMGGNENSSLDSLHNSTAKSLAKKNGFTKFFSLRNAIDNLNASLDNVSDWKPNDNTNELIDGYNSRTMCIRCGRKSFMSFPWSEDSELCPECNEQLSNKGN